MSVRWVSMTSKGFMVTNGVRQEGILAPYLFNIYMDYLSLILQTKYAGCKIAGWIINQHFYADDLVFMRPFYKVYKTYFIPVPVMQTLMILNSILLKVLFLSE